MISIYFQPHKSLGQSLYFPAQPFLFFDNRYAFTSVSVRDLSSSLVIACQLLGSVMCLSLHLTK